MDEQLKKQLTTKDKWFRLIYMIFFFVVNYLAHILVGLIILVQFILTLFLGKQNERLVDFGQGLSQFVYQVMRYLTYNTDDKPFPFSEWPSHTLIERSKPASSASVIKNSKEKAKSKVSSKAKVKSKPKTKTKAKPQPKTQSPEEGPAKNS